MKRLVLIACLTAAIVPAAGQAAQKTDKLKAFFEYDRPAAYGVLKQSINVAMRDGVTLGCILYRPTGADGQPAPGRFPGLIVQYLSYWMTNDLANGTDAEAGYYVSRGYVALHCTMRGTGTSGGTWAGWLSAQENVDNYDMIEWLAAQPFCTGKIGQEGESYGGMTSFRVATLQPPHLVAIAPQQAFSSHYLEQGYYGGIRGTADPFWAIVAGMGLSGPTALPYPQLTDWLEHPLLDSYWKQIDIWDNYAQIKVPVLGFAGWKDLFQDGMVRNYLGLSSHMYLIDGPWTHGSTFANGVTRGTTLAWFDHYLRGLGSAPMPPARIMSYEMPNGPWTTFGGWPAGTKTKTLALNGDGSMGTAAAAGTESYTADTAAGVDPTTDATSLSFRTAPLATDTVIAGAGKISLTAALTDPTGLLALAPDQVETNFVFHLFDVGPDGTQTNVTQGYLKASHLVSHEFRTIIDLNRRITYTIPLWHIHWRVAAGHSLLLQLTTGDQTTGLSGAPAILQPIPPLTVTVSTGQSGSTLALPVL